MWYNQSNVATNVKVSPMGKENSKRSSKLKQEAEYLKLKAIPATESLLQFLHRRLTEILDQLDRQPSGRQDSD
jgi:hypothetical protein